MNPDSSTEREWLLAELAAIQDELARGDTPSLQRTEERLQRLEAWHAEANHREAALRARDAAAIETARGHFERLHYRLAPAIRAYQLALQHLTESGLPEETTRQRAANLHTYLGLTYLLGPERDHWLEAARQFETSILLREADPDPDEEAQWGLSAAWINRGDALSRLGERDQLLEAIRCHDQGAERLRSFDLAANPAYRSRLALSHLNRAAALMELQLRHGETVAPSPFEHFAEAVAILRPGAELGLEESKRMLAVALTNTSRARLLLEPGSANSIQESLRESEEALRWIEGFDCGDWELLKLDLTARLSSGLARRALASTPDDAVAITDLVEEGIDHLRRYLSLGGRLNVLEGLAAPLLRCGAEVYARHLPHFLAEYLLDQLDPERGAGGLERSALCHEAAVEVLWAETARLKQGGFADLGTEAYERRAALESEWHQCRERLAAIRDQQFQW